MIINPIADFFFDFLTLKKYFEKILDIHGEKKIEKMLSYK